MEQVSNIANAAIKTFSASQQISTEAGKSEISPIEHAALFEIINKARLLNGWTMRTAKELDPTIRVWHEAMRAYKIPTNQLEALYMRAFDVRQSKLREGELKHVPTMDAALLISQWTGPNGLQSELRQREIDRGRTLGANAESVCGLCFGSGYRDHVVGGEKVGVRKCGHEEVRV